MKELSLSIKTRKKHTKQELILRFFALHDNYQQYTGRLARFLNDYMGDNREIDVKDKDKVFRSIEDLPAKWQKIDILVNNAGNAHGFDPIHEGSLDDWESMIDINVKGLLYVSKAVVPGMVERRSGHIINIGSIAGKEVYPNGNVYCASKHAVDAINNGMRIDLNQYGIKVSQVSPGLVDTEFSIVRFKGDKQRSDSVYTGMKPLTGDDIADLILFIVTRPAHVNISDSIIFPTDQASSTLVNRDQS